MKYLLLIIRIPFSLIAAYIMTSILGIDLMAFTFYWLIIFPPFWFFILLPINLIEAAFSNRADHFMGFISDSTKGWCQPIISVTEPETYLEIWQAIFFPIWRWQLIHGNHSGDSK